MVNENFRILNSSKYAIYNMHVPQLDEGNRKIQKKLYVTVNYNIWNS